MRMAKVYAIKVTINIIMWLAGRNTHRKREYSKMERRASFILYRENIQNKNKNNNKIIESMNYGEYLLINSLICR